MIRFSSGGTMVSNQTENRKLTPYLSPLNTWAMALGTSVGWGSLVVTSNTYLAQAGPAGSVLGILIGGVIMLVISRNYSYMISCFPEAGGAYSYAKEVFGHDHGFLTGWFLALTYFAMLWANVTSLPLFVRYFFGDVFRFGKMYALFGYDVYLGEVLLSVAVILIMMFFCMRFKRTVTVAMTAMVIVFAAGILVCFVGSIFQLDLPISSAFVPDQNAFGQIIKIACISPWAFIGFENISHGAEEYTFKRNRIFSILVIAVISTAALYIFVTLLSVTAYPPEYASWQEYIGDLGNLSGIKALPAFYAANHYLGGLGVTVLVISLLALILTSLIGNITALSRLFYAQAKDRIVSRRFADLNKAGIPAKTVILIALISIVITFFGRTAIGWIVDVTTIGATLIYGFVSASAMKMARDRGDRIEKKTGVIGLIIMIGFAAYLLIPNLFTNGSMATESYFLFVVWAVIGFIYFRIVLTRDQENRFGRSIIVWIALLSLVLFVSLVWMSQSNMNATSEAMSHVEQHYIDLGFTGDQSGFVAQEMAMIRRTNAISILVVIALFGLALGVLLNNYSIMSRRAQKSEEELGHVRNIANTDPLTGVKSKHAYVEAEKEADEQIAAGGAGQFAVVVCDVNGLKYVNDTLGHKAGDEMIREACSMVCEIFLHSPVFRIGGDEFAVLLKGHDYENRKDLLHSLDQLSVDHINSGEAVISAGMSEFRPGEDGKIHAVFERADALMYQRKKELKAMGARTR